MPPSSSSCGPPIRNAHASMEPRIGPLLMMRPSEARNTPHTQQHTHTPASRAARSASGARWPVLLTVLTRTRSVGKPNRCRIRLFSLAFKLATAPRCVDPPTVTHEPQQYSSCGGDCSGGCLFSGLGISTQKRNIRGQPSGTHCFCQHL